MRKCRKLTHIVARIELKTELSDKKLVLLDPLAVLHIEATEFTRRVAATIGCRAASFDLLAAHGHNAHGARLNRKSLTLT